MASEARAATEDNLASPMAPRQKRPYEQLPIAGRAVAEHPSRTVRFGHKRARPQSPLERAAPLQPGPCDRFSAMLRRHGNVRSREARKVSTSQLRPWSRRASSRASSQRYRGSVEQAGQEKEEPNAKKSPGMRATISKRRMVAYACVPPPIQAGPTLVSGILSVNLPSSRTGWPAR